MRAFNITTYSIGLNIQNSGGSYHFKETKGANISQKF